MSCPVRLVRITDAEQFAAYLARSRVSYARDKAEVEGISVDEALALAEAQHAMLLPAGPQTPGHHFRAIETADGTRCGELWYFLRGSEAFLYDIYIEPAHRRKGYGRAALELVEQELRAQGGRQLWLNVFASNMAARQFYESLGYAVGTLHMVKLLNQPPAAPSVAETSKCQAAERS